MRQILCQLSICRLTISLEPLLLDSKRKRKKLQKIRIETKNGSIFMMVATKEDVIATIKKEENYGNQEQTNFVLIICTSVSFVDIDFERQNQNVQLCIINPLPKRLHCLKQDICRQGMDSHQQQKQFEKGKKETTRCMNLIQGTPVHPC